jgi:hypothetical protein
VPAGEGRLSVLPGPDGLALPAGRLRQHRNCLGDQAEADRFQEVQRPGAGQCLVALHAEDDDRREPLMASAPFQIHVVLTAEQERSLFVDINANQKGLNSSHLGIMRVRLTPEEQEIKDHPGPLDRPIAWRRTLIRLAWPWHLGGSKRGSRAQGLTRPVNFASLQGGVSRTLAKSQYIHDLTSPEAQYMVIRNYWEAVKRTFADEWARPKDYLLLKDISEYVDSGWDHHRPLHGAGYGQCRRDGPLPAPGETGL